MSTSRRRFLFAVLTIFITQAVVGGLLYAGVVERLIDPPAWSRPEGQEHIGPYMISRVLFALMFTFLFTKFSPIAGVRNGVQFGLLIWLLYSIPMTIGFWAFAEMPDLLAVAWVMVGLFELVSAGAVLGRVLRPRSRPLV